MTLAEMRQGALDANWGPRKRAVQEVYLDDFQFFIQTASSTPLGAPFGTRARERDVSLVLLTHGSRPRRWSSQRHW